MGNIDRDFAEMDRILTTIKKQYVQALIDQAKLLQSVGKLSDTSLSGTSFATKQETVIISCAKEILRILNDYDDYLEKELVKIRMQIEEYKQLEHNRHPRL